MNTNYPYPPHIKASRVMVFVDGENLAMRYGHALGSASPLSHVQYKKDVYVWSKLLNMENHANCDTIRRYYYTSIMGAEEERHHILEELKGLGIEAPRVFKKYKQRGSKCVDISLAVDMLSHSHRQNYDLAILVAGDEDYVPLVDAVAAAGQRVGLWFLEDGLSSALRDRVDHYFDMGHNLLFRENAERYF